MKLYYREYGSQELPPLILLHGLLGSLVNWRSIARKLESQWRVIVPDLRNHGRSPHDTAMDYPILSADIIELMDELAIEQATIIGHSMGGKVAMWLALNFPHRMHGLVSVDIAPVNYPMRFAPVLEALLAIPLAQISSRKQADELLSKQLTEKSLRDYLLQNLVRENEHWQWRNNLPALHDNMRAITEFPEHAGLAFAKPALFIYGTESRYVQSEYHAQIKTLFPAASIKGIEGAGHWVYAEQPSVFINELTSFLNKL